MEKLIYLDNNATTRVAPEVVAVMLPCLEKHYGNPSSTHFFGGEAGRYVQRARGQVAKLLHCHEEEIAFTGCGSESIALAIRGVAALLPPDRRHIITTCVEHAAVKSNIEFLAQQGFSVTWLNVDGEGNLDLQQLKENLSEHTGLVSVMYANNETGVIFPIAEIAQIVKAAGAIFHVDGVQAVGKIPIDLSHAGIDLLSVAGHKFHAPKGVGALFVRAGVSLQPLLLGGHQEHGWRAGTEAVPNIAGLGMAAELAQKHMADMTGSVRARRDQLENWILSLPETRRNGCAEPRLPNTINVAFREVESETLLLALADQGVCVSAGAACTSGSIEPSRILKVMHVPEDYIFGSVRFSLSRYTTDEEIAYIMQALPKTIEKIKKICRQTAS
jgi:cysteine desulfurase